MIFIELNGGLCNRLRTIASSIEVGKTENSKILLLWKRYPNLNCYFLDIFKPIKGVKIIDFDSLNDIKKSRIKNYALRLLNLSFKILPFVKYISEKESENMVKNKTLPSLFKKKKWTYIATTQSIIDNENYFIFEPIDSIQKVIDLYKIKFTNAIGIHIRRTDNIWSIENSPTELFINIIREEIEKDPNTYFYLSTDDKEIEKQFNELFGEKIIVHDKSNIRRDTQYGIIDAVIDLYNLSNCKKIYGSYMSSFSDVAALIGNIPKIIVTKNSITRA